MPVNKTANVTCNDGYTLSGVATVKCVMEAGSNTPNWDNVPTCQSECLQALHTCIMCEHCVYACACVYRRCVCACLYNRDCLRIHIYCTLCVCMCCKLYAKYCTYVCMHAGVSVMCVQYSIALGATH